MEFVQILELSRVQRRALCDLWNNEYPKGLNYQTLSAFDNYLSNLTEPSHILIIDKNQKLMGWYCAFMRENEKWFMIIMDTYFQGKGLGTKVLNFVKEKETELNGWVIDHDNDKKKNGEIYNSPLEFYVKNDFEVISNTRLELETISAVKIKWKINNRS